MEGRTASSPVARTLPAVRILDRLQRELVGRLVAAPACDPACALRLLGAVATVQSAYEEIDAGRHDFQHLSGREAVGLLVEVAHDMRSPLSAVLFLVDMLRTGRSGAVSALQARQLALVYGAAFGLSQLATDLIDHVHGQERLIDRHPVPFSIAEMLNSVRDIVAPMAEEKGLSVRVAAPCEDARLGFPVALHRILLNLASNAVKYTPHGGVGLEASEVSAARLRFTATDTGPGMPRRVVSQLFEPFRSTPGAELPSFSGSGLGLSISKRLVTLLGGDLRVVTAPGKGTRFSFELDLPPVAKR
jgi:signal transduction histidine kinase